MTFIESTEQLDEIYGEPAEAALVKVTHEVTDDYRRFIELSPFVTIATAGPDGLDCSPRGDAPGFIRVVNSKQLQIPDRRGNNRVDSIRNIVKDPRVGLLFIIPGCSNTLRLNGRARISIDQELLSSFAVEGNTPRSVMLVDVADVYFQCGRALIRSDLWNPERHVAQESIPSPGTILSNLTNKQIDGERYDDEWPARARKTLW